MNRLLLALVLAIGMVGSAFAGQQFTLSADGSTDWFQDHNGEVVIQAAGTYGSGTLIVQIRLSDGTVQSVEGASWTSGTITQLLTVGKRVPVRFNLSGSTSPSIVGEFNAK